MVKQTKEPGKSASAVQWRISEMGGKVRGAGLLPLSIGIHWTRIQNVFYAQSKELTISAQTNKSSVTGSAIVPIS
ncbi:hypothetical protein STEG23_034145 [Scotinomys teguina]